MSKEIDWSKAPEWANYLAVSELGHSAWCELIPRKTYNGDNWQGGGNWAIADLKLNDYATRLIQKPVDWNGQGLPPVGVEVMFSHKCNDQGTGYVVAYGQEMCLIRNTSRGKERDQCGAIEDYEFRPIRTPEQIAEEMRDAAIWAMHEITSPYIGLSRYEALGALYDAGYRRVEAGK